MVHIINGEIVQDNDPRVLNRKRNVPTPGRSNVNSFSHGAARSAASPNSPPPQAGAPPNNPLSQLATAIGLEGTILVPAVPALNWRAVAVEKIYLAIFAVLVVMMGWRALAFGGIGYFIYQHQLNQPAAPTQ
ncbi:hypothetical protein LEN26_020496 [Aphanomyces euteiches]|nr:hypothetical protein AC1031_012835 [Aphanomyces cochlioides]KAH9085268.1 hypothetical protein LEN26_020496 [Aphanomyces euteiches]KAH9112886.1 hypothetical protein AeMF1_012856 [Aphanomyces euteiches]KAH9185969.1 hypothetical protein AeNC1_012058 [Aphanomyces euteiches]